MGRGGLPGLEAGAFLSQIDAIGLTAPGDRMMCGWICNAHAFHDHFLGRDPWQARAWADEGASAFRRLGDQRNFVAPQSVAALALAELGDMARAEETIRDALACAERIGHLFPITCVKMHLGLVLPRSADPAAREQARAHMLPWTAPENPNLLARGNAHHALAMVAERSGDLEQAEEHARRAGEVLAIFPPFRLQARAERIPAGDARERYLRQVPVNARALELGAHGASLEWRRRALPGQPPKDVKPFRHRTARSQIRSPARPEGASLLGADGPRASLAATLRTEDRRREPLGALGSGSHNGLGSSMGPALWMDLPQHRISSMEPSSVADTGSSR